MAKVVKLTHQGASIGLWDSEAFCNLAGDINHQSV